MAVGRFALRRTRAHVRGAQAKSCKNNFPRASLLENSAAAELMSRVEKHGSREAVSVGAGGVSESL